MDISSVNGSALTPELQAEYAVKCMSMAQQSSYVIGDLIQDTVEISAEAMARYTSEINASLERMV